MKGYYSHVVTDFATDWLKRPHDKPFLLCLGHKAPHGVWIPEPKYEHVYDDLEVKKPETAYDTGPTKPSFVKERIDTWHDMALRRQTSGSLLTGDRLGHDYPDVLWGKGPAVFQMLMDDVGGDPFVNMMRSVINRCPNYGVTNELLHQVAGEYIGDDVDAFWAYWVEGHEIPGLRSAFEVTDEDDGTFTVRGTIVFEDSAPPTEIPVALRYSGKDVDFRMVRPEGLRTEVVFEGLEKKPKKIEADPDELVLLKYRKPLKE